jgi:hypothetical protein
MNRNNNKFDNEIRLSIDLYNIFFLIVLHLIFVKGKVFEAFVISQNIFQKK